MSKQDEQPDWVKRITQFQASGMSMAAWCRENNVKVHQLRYRLHKEARTESKLKSTWLPLLPEVPETSALLIKVGPARIEVRPGFDPNLLRTVVRTLSSL